MSTCERFVPTYFLQNEGNNLSVRAVINSASTVDDVAPLRELLQRPNAAYTDNLYLFTISLLNRSRYIRLTH